MDLLIRYHLGAPAEVCVHPLLTRLRRSASGLAGGRVGRVEHLSGSRGWSLGHQAGVREVQVQRYSDGGFTYSLEVEPLEGDAFEVVPDERCGPALFGLARYPASVVDPRSGEYMPTQLGSSWHWVGGFSAEPALAGGVLAFLSAHLWVLSVLDRARELGCLSEISDPTGFRGDVTALAWQAAEWLGARHDFEPGLRRALERSEYERRPGRLRPLAARLREEELGHSGRAGGSQPGRQAALG